MTCKNCGAVMNGFKCEYCGQYLDGMREMRITQRMFCGTPYRDKDGRMHRCKVKDMVEVTCIGDTERHFIEV